MGIYSRGVPLAARLAHLIGEFSGTAPPLGSLDISFYRDDTTLIRGREPKQPMPMVRAYDLPFEVDGSRIILVDDVLYTGRTIHAAISTLFDYGRPGRIELAVMADRGHRELPIRPDYVGKNLPTAAREWISVAVNEVDGHDAVELHPTKEASQDG